MRGVDARNGSLFSYVDLEARVPQAHPLRAIRRIADAVLGGMARQFAAAYAPLGRPSIAPEKLLRALLLPAVYTLRSERQLVDRIDFYLLFRWFVGLGIDNAVWDASTVEEPRPVSRDGCGSRTAGGRGQPPRRPPADEPRPFLGRRHAH